ncbi:hypothetical protein EC2729250_2348 [Escherichia coli 2729250]|nr:hypothetical protein CJU64_12570 [Escherichia coli]EMV96649.1 hypothetical protein EC2860050_0885 [Escherichia coli 2860050]EMW43779.1 hypothetical protein EC2770900_5175 [Escherichia coli 2770900]EMW66080.1 hypothetical protein EC2747800_5387 [Escherichia coli 2747800]ENA52091.1 hypothetical protein EC2729250_2348 [Escherichia coli 2729250]ENH53851.1 hypothetical protein ECP03052937_0922 [Escherichia coli p0305293.7]KEM18259.1 hypothetical protein AB80_5298 [Escherichia coli 6-319-05_S1_C
MISYAFCWSEVDELIELNVSYERGTDFKKVPNCVSIAKYDSLTVLRAMSAALKKKVLIIFPGLRARFG